MAFSQQFLEELKARNRIEDVIVLKNWSTSSVVFNERTDIALSYCAVTEEDQEVMLLKRYNILKLPFPPLL